MAMKPGIVGGVIAALVIGGILVNSWLGGPPQDADASLFPAPEAEAAMDQPPFNGTVFIDPDILTGDDPSAFLALQYSGQSPRQMFDRRVDDWVIVNAFTFEAGFDDGLHSEIQVNPEFGSVAAATKEAEKYALLVGQLPTSLRLQVAMVWIHKGVELFGGGNNAILIHTGQTDVYEARGILEEVLIHEAAHTSIDMLHADSEGWRNAQAADGRFISTYARDNPDREDIAESFLPYIMVRHREDRIDMELSEIIRETIPNRNAYFDAQVWLWYPMVGSASLMED